jgi:cell division protein FtsQ
MTAPVVPLEAHRSASDEARSKRRHRRLRNVIIVLGALIITGLIWMVWFSSVFAVRDVRVVGITGVQADEVLVAGAVPLGVPLAQLDSDTAAARIALLPWVRSVEVRRGWPSEVVLAVEPRTAVAVQVGTGSGVDEAGVTFPASTALPAGLPPVDAEGVALISAMEVLKTLPADMRSRLVSMAATSRDDVTLTLRSGAIVRWGSAEQAVLKGQVIEALLKRRARVYDVTAPELPTTFDERPAK